MFEGAGIAVIILLAVVLFGLLRSIRMVPQGSNYTVERFGRYVRTLPPGLGIIVPFFDRVGHKLNMMERVLDVPSQEVITRDNAMVKVDGVAFFQVVEAAKAAYEVAESRKRHPQSGDDEYPHRHGLDGSRQPLVAARRDQSPPPGRRRSGGDRPGASR